ncbi:SRP19 protein [Ditylenchus destructor]|nr:SRP19 protein [Ditylenchus destructor]KAI1731186.1 SRP19 protein [Ditylenchus destructor]
MDIKAKPHSDESRWVVIYPLYINSKRTVAGGRRIAKEKCVEDPTCQEIADIFTHAGLKCNYEKKKMHPRDPTRELNAQGRIRVQLKNDDGSLCNESFPTRDSLMVYACEMIPKLKSRQAGGNQAPSQSTNAGGKQKKKK